MPERPVAFLLGLLALTTSVSAIYPDDHWDYATELTTDNFDEFVVGEIDSGRTLFAPAWNEAVKEFASNPDVSFADINLKEQKIRGDHNPGKGGWPTIKYFNQETGVAGAHYVKKTDKTMCDELGPKENYMTMYIEEAGKTSMCSLEDGAGCSEKQKEYIDKMKDKTLEEQEQQLKRLSGMEDSDMTPELKDWKHQRVKILTGLMGPAAEGGAEEEGGGDSPADAEPTPPKEDL